MASRPLSDRERLEANARLDAHVSRMRSQQQEPFLGVSEFAEVLGISKQNLGNKRKRDRLPEPHRLLAMGPVWTDEQVRGYINSAPIVIDGIQEALPEVPREVIEDAVEEAAGVEERAVRRGVEILAREYGPPGTVREDHSETMGGLIIAAVLVSGLDRKAFVKMCGDLYGMAMEFSEPA